MNADGTLGGLGAGFSATRNRPGNDTVSWPINTFSYFAFPVVTSVQSTAAPNIQRFALAGNGGGSFTVDFRGVDTSFSFALIQGRASSSPATSAQGSAQLRPITSR